MVAHLAGVGERLGDAPVLLGPVPLERRHVLLDRAQLVGHRRQGPQDVVVLHGAGVGVPQPVLELGARLDGRRPLGGQVHEPVLDGGELGLQPGPLLLGRPGLPGGTGPRHGGAQEGAHQQGEQDEDDDEADGHAQQCGTPPGHRTAAALAAPLLGASRGQRRTVVRRTASSTTAAKTTVQSPVFSSSAQRGSDSTGGPLVATTSPSTSG